LPPSGLARLAHSPAIRVRVRDRVRVRVSVRVRVRDLESCHCLLGRLQLFPCETRKSLFDFIGL